MVLELEKVSWNRQGGEVLMCSAMIIMHSGLPASGWCRKAPECTGRHLWWQDCYVARRSPYIARSHSYDSNAITVVGTAWIRESSVPHWRLSFNFNFNFFFLKQDFIARKIEYKPTRVSNRGESVLIFHPHAIPAPKSGECNNVQQSTKRLNRVRDRIS